MGLRRRTGDVADFSQSSVFLDDEVKAAVMLTAT